MTLRLIGSWRSESLRPWLFGIPAFALAALVLLWNLTHLASWILRTLIWAK